MRIRVFFKALILVLIAASSHAQTTQWQLADAQVYGRNGRHSYFLYVPDQMEWQDTTVSIGFGPTTLSRLRVSIGDRLIGTAEIDSFQKMQFDVGPLEAGFHELQLEILSRDPTGFFDPDYRCDQPIMPAMRLISPTVRFERRLAEAPSISNAMQVFYNPEINTLAPLRAGFSFDPSLRSMLPQMIATLGKMYPLLGAPRRALTWHEYDPEKPTEYDFVVLFKNTMSEGNVPEVAINAGDAAMGRPGQTPPSLELRFSDGEQLERLANALATPSYFRQMTRSTEQIVWPVAELPMPQLVTARSLAEIGVPSGRVGLDTPLNYFVPFERSLALDGSVTGTVRVRHPQGVPEYTYFEIWVDEELAGSARLDLGGPQHQQRDIPIEIGLGAPSQNSVLQFRLNMAAETECRLQAEMDVWLDAANSPLDVPLRVREGLQGLVANLVARPVIRISSDAPVISGALAATLMWEAAAITDGRRAIPFEVAQGTLVTESSDADRATLTIQVDPSAFNSLVQSNRGRLLHTGHAEGVFFELRDDGFHIVASNAEALEFLNQNLLTTFPDFPEYTSSAFITREGGTVILEQEVRVLPAVSVNTIRVEYLYAAAAAMFFFILVLGVALFRRRNG